MCVYYCSTYYKAVREGGGGGNGGHVLRETTGMDDMCYERLVVSRRVMCGLVCPSRTSERGGEGDCVKEEGGEGDRESWSMHWGGYYATILALRLNLNTAALAAASPTLFFKFLWNAASLRQNETSPIGCVAMTLMMMSFICSFRNKN